MSDHADTLRYYRDHEGKWRWQYRAANGNILADSGQGYSRLDKAEQGWRHIELAFGDEHHPAWFTFRKVVDRSTWLSRLDERLDNAEWSAP